jgi:hypothetical protein
MPLNQPGRQAARLSSTRDIAGSTPPTRMMAGGTAIITESGEGTPLSPHPMRGDIERDTAIGREVPPPQFPRASAAEGAIR